MNVFVGAALTGAAIPARAQALPSPNVREVPVGPHPDGVLSELADAYIAAERRYSAAAIALDHMCMHVNPPEVLRVQPRDFEMGKAIEQFDAADEHWRRPCDVDQWRFVDCWHSEKVETKDLLSITSRRIPASAELTARAAEIVAAFDAWHGKRPRGVVKAEREMKKIAAECNKARATLCETPATTLEGVMAKVRCLELKRDDFDGIDGSDPEPIVLSLLLDIQRIAGVRSA